MSGPAVRKNSTRPAFHFPPVEGGRLKPIRFTVYARLSNGSRVPIGATSTWEDAEALTRLIQPGSGAIAEIEGELPAGR